MFHTAVPHPGHHYHLHPVTKLTSTTEVRVLQISPISPQCVTAYNSPSLTIYTQITLITTLPRLLHCSRSRCTSTLWSRKSARHDPHRLMSKPKPLKEGQLVFRVPIKQTPASTPHQVPRPHHSTPQSSRVPASASLHTCPSCPRQFVRKSDLTRHCKSHTKPQYQCPYYRVSPTCHKNGGAFHRLDVYKRHLRLVHFVRDVHLSALLAGLDSNALSGWCGSCQKLFPNTKSFIDHVEVCEKLA